MQGAFNQESTVQDKGYSSDKLMKIVYIRNSTCIHLPTLISKFLNRLAQPHSDPLLTMYTSDTSSTCCRSTLHQGATWADLRVIVHDPLADANMRSVLLFPSTALLLLPSLYLDKCWYVGLPNARFSLKEHSDNNLIYYYNFLVVPHQLLYFVNRRQKMRNHN